MMIMILNHVHSIGEDSVIMKVFLNALSAIQLPLGQTHPVLRDTQSDEENYAPEIPRRLPHLSTVSSVTWTLGVCCPR